ncbi:MAG TPA: hypothetical protein VKG43_02410 [Acidimicrobiales bacterium]|nr:hypothetical protein [Acidimicrobiales bacterium]
MSSDPDSGAGAAGRDEQGDRPAGRRLVLGPFVPDEAPAWREAPSPWWLEPGQPSPFDAGRFEHGTRPRWPTGVRIMAWVVAASLVVGVVASGVGFVLGGSGHVTFATRVTSVGPGTANHENVDFTVTNTGSAAGQPVCTVQVVRDGVVLGSSRVAANTDVSAGSTFPGTVPVRVDRRPPQPAPTDGRVICTGG